MSKTYTTKQGDMWDSIAFNELGDIKYTDKLMTKNIKYSDYYSFPEGIVLELPEIYEEDEVADDLPPWKKV